MFSASKTAGPSGYNINNSLRFRASASANLSRTPSSSTNRNTWTVSLWAKRSNIGGWGVLLNSGTTTNFEYFTFRSDDTLQWVTYSGAILGNLITTQVFRDPSAWYHIVFAFDSTQATSSNRLKLYINGSQVTAFGTATYPSLNYNSYINLNQIHNIGRDGFGDYFDGYMAEYNFIDGQALTPASFGSTNATTGVWQPAKYTGSYGTNGFYLPFSDIGLTSGSNTGLGKDFSGNSNYWTTNNISVTAGTTYDAMTDSPTNTSATVANYCVLNPLDKGTSGTLDRANLQWSSGASWQSARGTMTIPSGKFYFEGIITSTTTGSIGVNFGLATAANPLNVGGNSNTASYSVDATSSSNVLTAGSLSGSGSVFTAGDVLQYAIDRDNNRAWFGRNNTWYNSTLAATGDPVAGTNPTWSSLPADLFPFINTFSQTVNFNFGQRPFAYTPPTGFNRLNTFNLPTSTIVKGNSYMDATTYTGTNANLTITNAGAFKPDFVWIKSRSVSGNHSLFNSISGANKVLSSSLTMAEETPTAGTGLLSFNSNGFTLGADIAGVTGGETNGNGFTLVGWQWQAGQGSTSSNTSGSITSTVSVSTTAGFSVVTYTGNGTAGATVGHGLGVSPSMVIIKNRSSVTNWVVRHSSLSSTQNVSLNTTDAAYTVSSGTANGGVGAFTSTTFGFISGTTGLLASNQTSNNYVAYCWAEIAGFSKFGSYTGNYNVNGTFVYCGFRPSWILIKCTNAAYEWELIDVRRTPYNGASNYLQPNLSSAEYSTTVDILDIVSNGFKLRTNWTRVNDLNAPFIFAAFAENPFKNALAR